MIHEVRIARSTSTIIHPMFVKDIILFGQANKVKVENLEFYLAKYQ